MFNFKIWSGPGNVDLAQSFVTAYSTYPCLLNFDLGKEEARTRSVITGVVTALEYMDSSGRKVKIRGRSMAINQTPRMPATFNIESLPCRFEAEYDPSTGTGKLSLQHS